MQRLEVSGAVRSIYGSLGVKRLTGRIGFHEDTGSFIYSILRKMRTDDVLFAVNRRLA